MPRLYETPTHTIDIATGTQARAVYTVVQKPTAFKKGKVKIVEGESASLLAQMLANAEASRLSEAGMQRRIDWLCTGELMG